MNRPLQAGFANPVNDAQAVFRTVLKALSEPARLYRLPTQPAAVPEPLYPACWAVALTLLDRDTRVYLSPALNTESIRQNLQFHCACELLENPQSADFVLTTEDQTPDLSELKAGTDAYPDQSCTLLIQSRSLTQGQRWQARGPGIRGQQILCSSSLTAQRVEQHQAWQRLFPLGVDVLLLNDNDLLGLPRTTKLELG